MSVTAPAKINLYLHVTGKRNDGYHLLDSLVVFADVGDSIEIAPHNTLTLRAMGPYADGIDVEDNTLIKAATLLRERFGIKQGAALTLHKHLPVGAGIGGGSADAAAVLKLLVRHWDISASRRILHEIGLRVGADVPACLHSSALYMEGIGEIITPIIAMPRLYLVLVNPGKSLLTKAVFGKYHGKFSATRPHSLAFANDTACIDFLKIQSNDLQDAAIQLMPEIAESLKILSTQKHCMLARMSGSGATCFGLFITRESAEMAVQAIQKEYPHWWCKAATTIGHEDE